MNENAAPDTIASEARAISRASKLAELRTAELRALEAADAGGRTTHRHHRRDLLAAAFVRDDKLVAVEPCRRCGGGGRYSFNPMDGTVCYGCSGSGRGPVVAVDAKSILRLERAADLRVAKRERDDAEREAAFVAQRERDQADVQARYPQAYEILMSYDGDNTFLKAMRTQLRVNGFLSPRMAETAVEAYERDNAPSAPAPSGRVVITGEVVSVKWRDSDWGATLKMVVKSDDGYKVWGSVPRDLDIDEGDRDVRVEFTATVEPSVDDRAFGFFKRPTKARTL